MIAEAEPHAALMAEPIPTIVIYGFDDAVAALRAAAAHRRVIRIEGAFALAVSLGPQTFRVIIDEASEVMPDAPASWVLDCGDLPGLAMAAFRAGVPGIRADVSTNVSEKLRDIAEQLGIRLLTGPRDGAVLDLADVADPVQGCQEWLKSVQK
jgi:hypothetical protein